MGMTLPMIRTSDAPDAKRMDLEDQSIEALLCAALNKYLAGGATIIKWAGQQGSQSLQFKPGTPNQPLSLQAFAPAITIDVTGDQAKSRGPYLVTMICEGTNIRYTTTGKAPSSTFGMLLQTGVLVTMYFQDCGNLQLCATGSGAIIDIEFSEVNA